MATHDRSRLRLVHNRAELDDVHRRRGDGAGPRRRGRLPARRHATRKSTPTAPSWRKRGVGYVTVAHLFFRQVATNANALPFLPDPLYDFFFPQRGKDRLTPRGEAVVRGLVENRILIDLSHMDPGGIKETFALLDEIDPDSEVPVISTHAGYRFGKQQYMCDEEILLQIKRRKGVVGLIMAQHQLNDGIRKQETDHARGIARGHLQAHRQDRRGHRRLRADRARHRLRRLHQTDHGRPEDRRPT